MFTLQLNAAIHKIYSNQQQTHHAYCAHVFPFNLNYKFMNRLFTCRRFSQFVVKSQKTVCLHLLFYVYIFFFDYDLERFTCFFLCLFYTQSRFFLFLRFALVLNLIHIAYGSVNKMNVVNAVCSFASRTHRHSYRWNELLSFTLRCTHSLYILHFVHTWIRATTMTTTTMERVHAAASVLCGASNERFIQLSQFQLQNKNAVVLVQCSAVHCCTWMANTHFKRWPPFVFNIFHLSLNCFLRWIYSYFSLNRENFNPSSWCVCVCISLCVCI